MPDPNVLAVVRDAIGAADHISVALAAFGGALVSRWNLRGTLDAISRRLQFLELWAKAHGFKGAGE